jgi:hypothetical protein
VHCLCSLVLDTNRSITPCVLITPSVSSCRNIGNTMDTAWPGATPRHEEDSLPRAQCTRGSHPTFQVVSDVVGVKLQKGVEVIDGCNEDDAEGQVEGPARRDGRCDVGEATHSSQLDDGRWHSQQRRRKDNGHHTSAVHLEREVVLLGE